MGRASVLNLSCQNNCVNKQYLNGVYPAAAIFEKENHFHPMEAHVREVASEIAGFAHCAIRISYTGERYLKQGNDSFITEMCSHMSDEQLCDYLAGVDRQIHDARKNLVTSFNRKKENGVSRDAALAQVYAELVIRSVESNTGNCAEKALLAGILLKSSLTMALMQHGYTDIEIENANFRIAIAENGNHGGDHTVCLLRYNLGSEKVVVVDPWLNGSVYDEKSAAAVYATNLENPNEPSIFDKVDDNKTQAVNDEQCVAEVMRSVKSIFGDEFELLYSSTCTPVP